MVLSIPYRRARWEGKRPKPSALRQRYLDRLVAAPLYALFAVFRLLPIDAASALGSWIGRTPSPRIAFSRRAEANLQLVMPDLSAADRHRIVVGMWDNLLR